MAALLVLVVVSILVEAIWEALKPVLGGLVDRLQAMGIPIDRIMSLVIALVICLGIGWRVDLFVLIGLGLAVPYIGLVLTAIILSRGSNFVHDLLSRLEIGRNG